MSVVDIRPKYVGICHCVFWLSREGEMTGMGWEGLDEEDGFVPAVGRVECREGAVGERGRGCGWEQG